MKKLVSVILTLGLLGALLTGCGGGNAPETTAPAAAMPETPLEVLETVWASYSEEEQFPIGGGDLDNFVMGAPGEFRLENVQNLTYTLLLPEDSLASVTEAATMLHGMNTNIFTSGVLRMAEGTDLEALAGTIRESLLSNQWICGMPERMLLATIGSEYLLVSFGNGEIMDIFQNHVQAAYPQTQVLHTDNII